MFSADLGGYTAPLPAATDPPFQKVALLLHGDGTNGAQNNTFVDSSTNNFTITSTGNVAQGTFSPFSLPEGQWSNYFDGTGDYLQIPDNNSLDLSSDFTIDLWMYWIPRSGETYPRIVTKGDYQTSTAAWQISGTASSTTFSTFFWYGNPNVTIGIGTITPNNWNHIAVSRTGTTLRTFLNGVLQNTSTVSTDFTSTDNVRIGAGSSANNNELFSGYISNIRIVKGTAVYTSDFTPSTSPLTAISGTSLLTCQSNRFNDNSSNNFTITRNGDTKVTAFSPFAPSAAYSASTNGGSAYFDGTGDWLTVGTPANFGTNDFTIEGWVNFSSIGGGYPQFLSANGSTSPQFAFTGSPNINSMYFYNGSTIYSGSFTFNFNSWYHVAWTRNSGTMLMFVNGVQIHSFSYSSAINLSTAALGGYAGGTGNGAFHGYMSNVRVVNGTAVYTSNFTPPTAPLTAVTNTQLLLNCTNAGIIDNAGKNDIETVGNAQISTSVKKYGTGSMYFDGSGDWLLLADRPELQLGTGKFTVEGWLYLGATGAARGIVGKGTSTTGWLLSINSSNQVVFTYGSSTITSTGTLSGSTWYHIAVCREGTGTNQTKIYINGSNDGTGTVNTNFNQTNVMYVGANRTGGDAMNGYIDDLRITQGQALYTSNFTPPTQAFPNV